MFSWNKLWFGRKQRRVSSRAARPRRVSLLLERLEDRLEPSSTSILAVSGFPSPVTAGAPGSVTVTAEDASGNVTPGYRGTVHFTSTDYFAALPADYTFSASDSGIHSFNATLKTAGTQSLTARDTASPAASSIGGTQSGISVHAAAANHLFFTMPGDSVAGSAFTITVSARDPYGNIDPTYAGMVHFTSSDPQAMLPADYTFTAGDAGSHTFTNGVDLYTVTHPSWYGQSVTVTDTASGIYGTAYDAVKPAAASAYQIAVPAAVAAGSPFSVTVTAVDPYGNVATSYRGSTHFTSSDAAPVLPADYTFTYLDLGVHTFISGVTFNDLGVQTVTATDTTNSSMTATTPPITINPEVAGLHFTVSASVSSCIAGTPFDVTVTALDGNGNVATGYTGTATIASSDTGVQAVLPLPYTFTAADAGVHTFAGGVVLVTAGNQTITVYDRGITDGSSAGSTSVQVSPAAASKLGVTGFPSSVTAGNSGAFTVTALDPYGNVATGYAGTVSFSSSDVQASLPANYTFAVGDAGVHSFTATLKTAASQSLTATDTSVSSITGKQSGITVTAAAAARLAFTLYGPLQAGTAATFTVTALDAYGNLAVSYAGTIHFTSSDAQAVLPNNYTFTGGDRGQHAFSSALTLKTAGSQTVTATDTGTGSINGATTVTVNPGPAVLVYAYSTPSFLSTTAGQAFTVTAQAEDRYFNIVPTFTGTIFWSSSDHQPTLPSSYTFTSSDQGVHTFNNATILRTAGWQRVTVSWYGTQNNSTSTFYDDVTAAAASRMQLSVPSSATAGAAFDVTVTTFDRYGNIATGYAGTVHFTSSDGTATLPADYVFTANDAGTHTFSSGAILDTAGTQTITATDGTFTNSAQLHINPAAASHFQISAPASSTAGSSFSVTLTALDPFNNVDTNYRGTVHFTSSDGQAALPADYKLTASDAGIRTFSNGVTLDTAGNQTVTATDAAKSSITGSGTVAVNPAAAASLALAAPATTTAGDTFSVTVTALDPYDNVATGYTGTVHFTSSDPQAALPADSTLNNGAGSFHVTLLTAGTQSITATDTATASITGSSNLAVSPAAAATLAVSGFPSPTTAGASNTFTVTALDPYGNTATGYTGSIHFSSSDAQAALPADYTYTAGDGGSHVFSTALKTAGTQSLSATDVNAASITGTQGNITVAPAAAASFVVSGFPSTTTAGASHNFTVTALDAYGNTATEYAGTVHFTSSDGQASVPADYAFASGDAGVHTFNATLKTAGTQSLTATDSVASAITGVQGGITVNPTAAAIFTVSGFPTPTTAGDSHKFTVTALDAYGNTATGYAGTVHFTSSDAQASVPADYAFTSGDAGVHTFNATLRTAGTQSLTATDSAASAITGVQGGITVNPAAAAIFTVSGYPTPVTAGTSHNFTVTALDTYGNTATGYTGSVHFTSSDGQASLPADYTFAASDAGIRTFSASLKTAGIQSLTATDKASSSITGMQGSITVNPAAAAAFTVSGYPSPTTAGSSHNLTVTALDVYGNTATGYTGTVHFTSSDGQASLWADYTFAASDAGIHTFSATLKTAGMQSLTATDKASSAITGTEGSITVNPAAAAVFTISGYPSPTTAGSSHSVTVTALDAYGNAATGYAGAVHFTSSDGQASLPADYTFSGSDAGIHTFSATLKTAGTQSLTATDQTSSAITGTQENITVNPAAAAAFTVSGYPSPTTAGSSHNVTVTTLDAYGNTATGYTGAVHFTSSDGQSSLPADYTFAASDGGIHTFSATLKTAGTQSLTATDKASSSITGTQGSIMVNPATAATFTVGGYPSPTTAGSSHNLTVTALDAYGNTATGYSGTVHFTSSDGQASLPADYSFTASDVGIHTFSATLKTAGTQSLTATDKASTSITGTQGSITVNSATAAVFTVSGYPSPTTAGSSHNLTVTALDAYGNMATGYTGTVHFTSSDGQASLPADYTFTATDAGIHTFSATLKTAGTQSLKASDKASAGITGTQGNITVNPAAAATFTVSGYPSSTTAGVSHNFTVTALDAYGNVASGYTGTVHFTSSDAQAGPPADYAFTAADAGAHGFSVTLKTAGTQSLTAVDTKTASITGSQTGIAVAAAAATSLSISAPASVSSGGAFKITVTALDAYGNVAAGYRGTIHFTSSDRKAKLPADYTFVSGDAGAHTFNVTLTATGTQSITATDTTTGSIKGSANINVSRH